jgi:hypothetical protein
MRALVWRKYGSTIPAMSDQGRSFFISRQEVASREDQRFFASLGTNFFSDDAGTDNSHCKSSSTGSDTGAGMILLILATARCVCVP